MPQAHTFRKSTNKDRQTNWSQVRNATRNLRNNRTKLVNDISILNDRTELSRLFEKESSARKNRDVEIKRINNMEFKVDIVVCGCVYSVLTIPHSIIKRMRK